MVGAIIGATVSAGSALANYLTTKRQNQKLKDELRAEQSTARSQEITDRYGNWRYSGANQYFTRVADEVKNYVRQQRGRNKVTGSQNTGAEEAASNALAKAAGQATAQREAVGLEMAQKDRQRYQQLKDQERAIDHAQSQATTQAWTQLANAAGNLATAIDKPSKGSGGSGGDKIKHWTSEEIKNGEAANDAMREITDASDAGYQSGSVIDFDGQSQADAEKVRKGILGF